MKTLCQYAVVAVMATAGTWAWGQANLPVPPGTTPRVDVQPPTQPVPPVERSTAERATTDRPADHTHAHAADHGHGDGSMKVAKNAVAVMTPKSGSKVRGTIRFTATESGVRIQGQINNLSPGKHGFHIHEFGDLRGQDGSAAGDHYNPTGADHGGPGDKERHVGDLGNVEANDDGQAKVDMTVEGLKLHFILGRSIVVHAEPDDLESQPAGDAGARIGIGVIGVAETPTKTKAQEAAAIDR